MIKEIHPLLNYQIKDGNLIANGPMSPTMAAKEFSKSIGIKMNHLARVWFNDDRMLQEYDGGEGLTAYDHLIIVNVYKNTIEMAFIVDMGYACMPIAIYYSNDQKVITSPVYRGSNFALKITDEQLSEMFNTLVEHREYYISYNYDKLREERLNEKHKV